MSFYQWHYQLCLIIRVTQLQHTRDKVRGKIYIFKREPHPINFQPPVHINTLKQNQENNFKKQDTLSLIIINLKIHIYKI